MSDNTPPPTPDRGDIVAPNTSAAAATTMSEVDLTDKLDDTLETPEERTEREAQEAAEAKKAQKRIPLNRHEAILQKARDRELALKQEIAQLRGGQQQAATQQSVNEAKAELEKLEDKYEDLILDGKKDEARAVRRQISQARDALVDHTVQERTAAARVMTVDDVKFDERLTSIEAKYPELNPDSDRADEAKITETGELIATFVKAGMKRAEALTKAVRYVMGPEPTAGKAAPDKRAEEARRKAADASVRQPPNAAKVGLNSDKAGTESGIDISRMTPAQFAKLSEEERARLRGDEL